MNPVTKRIYKEIAEELGVEFKIVEAVVENQFKFVKDAMAEGEIEKDIPFKNINIKLLGKFVIKEKQLNKYIDNFNKKNGE